MITNLTISILFCVFLTSIVLVFVKIFKKNDGISIFELNDIGFLIGIINLCCAFGVPLTYKPSDFYNLYCLISPLLNLIIGVFFIVKYYKYFKFE